jgi:hypothetical protein
VRRIREQGAEKGFGVPLPHGRGVCNGLILRILMLNRARQ